MRRLVSIWARLLRHHSPRMLGIFAKAMTESDFIEKIKAAWPRTVQASATEALRLVEEGLCAFPRSARLLCIKGDLIQLSDGEQYELSDALRCYQQAADLAPESAEAFESMGFFFDAIESDPVRAESAFRTAVKLGGGPHTYAGLARVLSGRGHSDEEVLALLDGCPHAQAAPVQEMKSEIIKGMWKPVISR